MTPINYFASIAQLGERKTEDLEAPCSIHGRSRYDLSQWKIIITTFAPSARIYSYVFPFSTLVRHGSQVELNKYKESFKILLEKH